MGSTLTSDEIAALERIDTATITNAVDYLHVRPPTAGYTSTERCDACFRTCRQWWAMPLPASPIAQPPLFLVGEASTWSFYEALRDAPKPAVVIYQDIGIDRARSNQFGDIMATTFQRLGAVGAVTDGGIRDLGGMAARAPGFQMFATGAVAASGEACVVEVGLTVAICGLLIAPGDLLHGDANGLTTVPIEIAAAVASRGEEVLRKEDAKVAFIKGPDFSLERLAEMNGWRERLSQFGGSWRMFSRTNHTKRKLKDGGVVLVFLGRSGASSRRDVCHCGFRLRRDRLRARADRSGHVRVDGQSS